ncbi:MAG TPA: hypothetical protein PKH16_15730 [Aequorivita sp.]|nr:hypothetical protein [Aequorivita sp.]
MEPFKLNFADFISAENYYHLIHKFLSKDINYKFTFFEDLKIPSEDIKIEVFKDKIVALFNPEAAQTIIIHFEEDFLLINIPKMADYYFENLLQSARSANQNTPENLEYFFMPVLEELNSYTRSYSKANFLSENTRKLIIEETYKLIRLCEAYLSNPYPEVQKKLKFRLKRMDVEAFFFLLREKKVIEHIENADLGRIIENICEYQPNKDSKEFKVIRDSATKIGDINNMNRVIDNSLKKLSQIFNTNFFTFNSGSK